MHNQSEPFRQPWHAMYPVPPELILPLSELQNQLSFIQNCYQIEPLKFNKDTDFSNDGVLKESALSHSPFIRHSK